MIKNNNDKYFWWSSTSVAFIVVAAAGVHVLVEQPLHGQEGDVVAAAGVHQLGEVGAQVCHLVGTVHPLLHVVLVVEAAPGERDEMKT